MLRLLVQLLRRFRALVVATKTMPGRDATLFACVVLCACAVLCSADDGSCRAWGYGSEDQLSCYGTVSGMTYDMDHECWTELDQNPTCCGYCGPWTSTSYVDTCTDLDIIRVSDGCCFSVLDSSGTEYSYDQDQNFCYNGVGCDSAVDQLSVRGKRRQQVHQRRRRLLCMRCRHWDDSADGTRTRPAVMVTWRYQPSVPMAGCTTTQRASTVLPCRLLR